jgi:acetyltransferase
MRIYPAHLAGIWTLASGEALLLRPIRHDDGDREVAFLRALSRETLYQRLLSGGRKLTRQLVDSLTHIDYRSQMAYAVTTTTEGTERFVGVGRYVVDTPTASAELALVLADAWQRQGLGRRLLETLVEHARIAGVREAVGTVFATNRVMLRLARSVGFAVRAESGDATVKRIVRTLAA